MPSSLSSNVPQTDVASSPPARKQQLNTRTNELEALEARIREMEQRLKTQKPNPTTGTSFASLSAAAGPSQPSRPQQLPLNPREQPDSSSSPAHSPRRARVPVGSAFDQPQDRPQPTPPQQQQQQQYARRPAPLAGKPPSRGSTGGARASQQAVPGALPPTPGASEGESSRAPP